MASTTVCKNAIHAPQSVLDLLARLHKQSFEQEEILKRPDGGYNVISDTLKSDPANTEAKRNEIMLDKFIALDADKAALVYSLIRATGALNVVEAGTSFGVSTIYLALAVGQNAEAAGKTSAQAKVIATEFESSKATQARKYWREAGSSIEPWIDLREGDLLQTLKGDLPVIDFVLLDSELVPRVMTADSLTRITVWTPMVVPTLELLEPHFRPGTLLVADNTVTSASGYQDFFKRISTPGSGYRTLTLPYSGGLELVTYWPKAR